MKTFLLVSPDLCGLWEASILSKSCTWEFFLQCQGQSSGRKYFCPHCHLNSDSGENYTCFFKVKINILSKEALICTVNWERIFFIVLRCKYDGVMLPCLRISSFAPSFSQIAYFQKSYQSNFNCLLQETVGLPVPIIHFSAMREDIKKRKKVP